MEVILITGRQGSGKNKKAYELVGLGKRFIEITADSLNDKHSLESLSDEHENIIIIDETESIHLHSIKKFILRNGKILYRKPYTMEPKEFDISKLIVLSQQDLSKSFRADSFLHIKL